MLKHLLVLASAVAVAGCANVFSSAPVSEPKDGERARLRGVIIPTGDSSRWTSLILVDQNVCGDRPDLPSGRFVDEHTQSKSTLYKKRSIGMPNGMHGMMTKQTWGEMYIRADQQVNIKAAHFLGGAEHCDATVYFKPEKDKDYEFTIDLVDNVCVMSPRDITGGEVITLQVSKRKLSCKRDETAKTRKSADPRIVKAIKLKGGSCVFHELDMNPRIVPEGMKEGEKAFTLGLKCTLKRGTDLLEKSKFIAPDGQQYNAGGLTVRDENGSSIYEFSFSVPEDVDVKKLKYVYGNQMLLLDK